MLAVNRYTVIFKSKPSDQPPPCVEPPPTASTNPNSSFSMDWSQAASPQGMSKGKATHAFVFSWFSAKQEIKATEKFSIFAVRPLTTVS